MDVEGAVPAPSDELRRYRQCRTCKKNWNVSRKAPSLQHYVCLTCTLKALLEEADRKQNEKGCLTSYSTATNPKRGGNMSPKSERNTSISPLPPGHVYICSGCGKSICEGAVYWEFFGEQFCGKCNLEHRRIARREAD